MNVFVKSYPAPPIDRREILRYAGMKEPSAEVEQLLDSCLLQIDKLSYQVCWREFAIRDDGDTLDLGFTRTASADLRRNLMGCHSLVLFAATVGLEIDRLIARAERLSPASALLLQAIGSERVEAVCDEFNRDITAAQLAQGRYTRPRFSPGYGDLPLALQRDIFAVLDCPRRIGISLNQSLMMSPSKSVTAIIGISNDPRR